MLISLETLLGIFNVDGVFIQHLQDFWVNWHLLYAYDRTSKVLFTLHQVEPGVLSDVFYFIPFFWVGIQDLRYEVFGVIGNEFRKLKVGIQNLFVEQTCVRVLKGQVATDKCKKNDST